MRSRSFTRVALAGAAVLTSIATIAPSAQAADPVPDTYVALGDSYTAGPLILNQSLAPLGCLRSDRNYAARVAPRIKVSRFVDVSCSGADTSDMFSEQGVTPGPNPPQLDAVDARTKVVTLGIGGNDIGFSSIIEDCAALLPWEAGCKGDFVSGGTDTISTRIAAAGPKVDAVLQAIAAKAPAAKVFVIGYPAILPERNSGCWPVLPIVNSDVPYLRDKEKELNAMLAARAAANGATYVDTYTPSIGRDACALPGIKWVEGLIPFSVAAPVHPNALGMAGVANVIAPRINTLVPS